MLDNLIDTGNLPIGIMREIVMSSHLAFAERCLEVSVKGSVILTN